ncbi:MAG TPA: DUF4350 domain-containing protein [Chthonomonadaceae bacterium]|nr:DUF4350 domain-containing protein [Chthonomonadaceae bacterium]
MLKRRGSREVGGLIILFVLLIGIAAFYEKVGQERVAAGAPTTVNTGSDGVRALMLLYRDEGTAVEPLTTPWNDLGPGDGLLIFVEPGDTDRRPTEAEDKALERWVRAGGTFLDLVAEPPLDQPLNPKDPVEGDCGAKGGATELHDVPVMTKADPQLLGGVATLSVQSSQRLLIAKDAPYALLAQDASGPIAAEKRLGAGRVIAIANRHGATNAGLAEADNALLLVNIARLAAAASHRRVRFDEYHHGVGFAENTSGAGDSEWNSIPLPWRFAILYLLGACLIIVYNGNRRFGPARFVMPIALRASTDYVNSMARLYRRAGAADIAIEILYTRFLRDLKRTMDVPNEAGLAFVATAAEQRYGQAAFGLRSLLMHGESIHAGQRVAETDMLNLAKQMEEFRRALQLVGV